MACYHPLSAFRCHDGSVVFDELRRSDIVQSLSLPCGQCIGCRLERSRQWAVRCMHEASLYSENCFVTLTYNPEFVPVDGSLNYRHFQLFLKRLRRRFSSVRIRFYMCGEYGEEFFRPHFHACLFGFDFPDKVYLSKSAGGSRLYTSAELARLWTFGFSSVGAVTFESAAYVARYVMKKVTGWSADQHYEVVDLESGEVRDRVPEFNHMSLKPGIGRRWIEAFTSDVYPSGEVVVNGKKARAPRYYDKFFEGADGVAFEALQYERYLAGVARSGDNTDARLAVREQVTAARLRALKRSI